MTTNQSKKPEIISLPGSSDHAVAQYRATFPSLDMSSRDSDGREDGSLSLSLSPRGHDPRGKGLAPGAVGGTGPEIIIIIIIIIIINIRWRGAVGGTGPERGCA